MLTWGAWYMVHGEKIEENQGLGWDGKMYAAIAAEFESFMTKGTLDRYYYKRSLPSAVVHYAHKVSGIEFTIESVIKVFSVLNLTLILGAMLLWHSILEIKAISFWNRVVAFLGIFGSYAMVKVNFYYPVLTDTSALFIATWMLYAYVKQNNWALFFATIAGTFTFPTLFITGTLLLLFQENEKGVNEEEPAWVKYYIPWVGSGLFLCFFLYAHFFHREIDRPTASWLIWPSIALAVIYTFLTGRVFKWAWALKQLKHINLRWLITIGVFYLAATSFVFWFAASRVFTFFEFVNAFIQRTAFAPLAFLEAHVTYYGPIVMLIILFRKRFLEVLYQQQAGFVFVVFLNILFAINPVSRHLIGALPFFAYVLCLVLEKEKLNAWFYGIFVVLTLAFSRFWFTINTAPFTGDYLAYPDQRYFMADGQYTSLRSYIIQGLAALICAGILWLISGRKRSYS